MRRRNSEGLKDDKAQVGQVTGYTCPECHGAIWQDHDGSIIVYRCRVGHTFSAENMVAGQVKVIEDRLWSTLVALEENASLTEHLIAWARQTQNPPLAAKFKHIAQKSRKQAKVIKTLVQEPNE